MEKSKVLMIDDNQANLLALEALLATYVDEEGEGIEAIPADSGQKGLQILLDTRVDLILLDVQMPHMDGYETARLIGMRKRTSSIPIIFLSAVYNDEIHMTRGYQGGAIDFISKPINPTILIAKVGNFLKIQRAIRRAVAAEKEKDAVIETTRMKSQFLMNMNHELRTPMNGVLGMTDVLLANELLSADQRECIEAIKASGKHMLRIVDDILDIASLEAKQLSLTQRPFNPKALLDEVVALYRFQIDHKQLQIEVTADQDLKDDLIGDPRRLKQAIGNLLSNALKFTERGKISVSFSVRHQAAEQVEAEIEVTDTGIGIHETERDHLFQLFAQGDASSTKKYAGTGLGLIITKRLVELMGGRTSWTSERGKGSSFKLTIPFPIDQARASTATTGSSATAPEPANSKGRILIVEDNPVNQMVAQRIVKRLGYSADLAMNGREGVEAFKQNDYQAILMDCLMPEMDGFEATRLIRLLATKHIPIIAVTANATAADEVKCRAAGMDGFIPKPLQIGVLESELNRWKPAS